MKVERVFSEDNNNDDITKTKLEDILYDLLDNYINQKYNLNKINNATSSVWKDVC